MKILFFNLWNFKFKNEIEEFLVEHAKNTDIFCLQEAYGKTKLYCKEILPSYELMSDQEHISDKDKFSQATYIKNEYKIIESSSILRNFKKTGLALHTQINYQGKIVNICNVHGMSQPGDKKDTQKRLMQSQEIIDKYKNLKGYKIIGGDFNLDADTKSVKLFEENGYANLIKKYQIPTTRNRLVWEKYPGNKLYFSDFVFVSPDIAVREFEVPNIEISDHLPMILEVNV